MSDVMTFPETVDDFMEQHKVVDAEKVYTSGIELVPIFRMKQWFEHLPAVPHEMSAREFLNARNRMCKKYAYGNCPDCPAHFVCVTAATNDEWPTKGVAIVEKWAQEHPERSEDDGGQE